MNPHLIRIVRPVKWDILENFYKDIEGGVEKVAKMKMFCESDEKDDVFDPHKASQMRYALANYEFLYDRRRKMNDEFEWNEENKKKLVEFDTYIRKIEAEVYQTFLQTKKHLDGLIAQGHERYKDYQVEVKIAPSNYWDIRGVDDWTAGLLMDYAGWEYLDSFTFGDGQDPENPFENDNAIIDAWDKWLEIKEFSEHGMTFYTDHLLTEPHWSLYSYSDIINMDLHQFFASYKILYYGKGFEWKPKEDSDSDKSL